MNLKMKLSRLLLLLALVVTVPVFAQQMDKKKGKVTTYYQNGKKESSGKVKNYQRQGTWKFWDTEGYLEKTVTFKDGKKLGAYTEFYHDGSISTQGLFDANEEKTGAWNSFFQGGKKSAALNYAHNKYEGLQQWWYENGQLREQSMYSGNVIAYRWSWYYTGKKKAIETYKNGLAEGAWRMYPSPAESSDTLPSSVDEYAGGKRNGQHTGYAYGKRTEEIYYKDDQLHGTYQKWDETGLLGISENYKNGQRDGTCRYFDKGKLMRQAEYKNGKLNGAEKEYYFNTSETKTSWYRNGVLDSVYTYFSSGRIESTRIYKYYPGFVKTEEFSFYTEYDAEGHKLISGEYHFEARDRYWVTYYPDGKMKSQTPYGNGKIVGVYKKWYANGKPLIEMECDGANVIAQPKVWDEKGRPLKPGTKDYEAIVESSKPGEVYNDPTKYRSNRTTQSGTIKFVEPKIVEDDDASPPQIREIPVSTVDMVQGVQDVPMEVTQDGVEGDVMVVEANPVSDGEELFQYVEQMPEFPGGAPAFQQFLKDTLVYPPKAEMEGRSGTVYVEFVVEKDGSITNIKVKKGIPGSRDLDLEAVRVIGLSPKWKPGKQNGVPVRVTMIQPIRFKIE